MTHRHNDNWDGIVRNRLTEEEFGGRVQVHYDSQDGYGKPIKVLATVPPMTEKPINSKYDMARYLEKYLKDMKAKGIIKGMNYEIVYPHDPKWKGPK